eukprot:943790_1
MSSICRALVWINLVRRLVSTWSSSSSSRTTADYGFAIGSYNGNISLIGGTISPQGLTIYEIASDSFSDPSSPLTADISGLTQFYTQSEQDIVYMISSSSTSDISTYDLATNVFVPSFNTDHELRKLGCLASHDNYLFLIGGVLELGTPSYTSFQVLNTTSGSWLSGPAMTTARAEHACIAHAGHVWAFGGSDTAETSTLSSIERISTRGGVTTQPWEAYAISLSNAVIYARAVGYSHYIYVIGGLSDIGVVDTVQIIDTIQTTITTDDLAYAVDATGGTFSDPFLYAFGGRTQTSPVVAKDTFLSFDTTTSSPTKFPTQPPSTDPSAAPSKTPSDAPSQNPSVTPSKFPSKTPSEVPSTVPSGTPSRNPSIPPTNVPSVASDAPTAPSEVPTDAPTEEATDAPETTEEEDEGGGDTKAANDGMGVMIGLSVAGMLVVIGLLVVGLWWYKKKDEQYDEEVRVRRSMHRDMREQVVQMGGMTEEQTVEQIKALSMYEQRRKSQQTDQRNRQVSLQGQPVQQPKPAQTVDPAKDLGTVKEDETKPDAALPETGDTETGKAEDKGPNEADAEKQADAVISVDKADNVDADIALNAPLIAVDTADVGHDEDDEKASEVVTAGVDEDEKGDS